MEEATSPTPAHHSPSTSPPAFDRPVSSPEARRPKIKTAIGGSSGACGGGVAPNAAVTEDTGPTSGVGGTGTTGGGDSSGDVKSALGVERGDGGAGGGGRGGGGGGGASGGTGSGADDLGPTHGVTALWRHFEKGDKMLRTNKFEANCLFCREHGNGRLTRVRGEKRMMAAHLRNCRNAPDEAKREAQRISTELKQKRAGSLPARSSGPSLVPMQGAGYQTRQIQLGDRGPRLRDVAAGAQLAHPVDQGIHPLSHLPPHHLLAHARHNPAAAPPHMQLQTHGQLMMHRPSLPHEQQSPVYTLSPPTPIAQSEQLQHQLHQQQHQQQESHRRELQSQLDTHMSHLPLSANHSSNYPQNVAISMHRGDRAVAIQPSRTLLPDLLPPPAKRQRKMTSSDPSQSAAMANAAAAAASAAAAAAATAAAVPPGGPAQDSGATGPTDPAISVANESRRAPGGPEGSMPAAIPAAQLTHSLAQAPPGQVGASPFYDAPPDTGVNSRGCTVVTNDGVRLWCETKGEGHPLVLIHGWSGSSKLFMRNYDALAESFKVIRYDLRGHGDSETPEYGFHVARLAVDLLNILDHFGLERVALLGCSLGCAVIWSFVELFGTERITAALFVDQSPWQMYAADGSWRLGSNGLFSDAGLADLCASLRHDPAGCHLGTVKACLTRSATPEEEAFFVGESSKAPSWFLAKLMADHNSLDWRATLPLVTCPALVIAGKRSKIFPWEGVAYAADAMPNAKLIAFSEGSHWLYWEESDRFNAICVAFLSSIVSSSTV